MPPAGHQGKKDKAYASWKAKKAAAAGHSASGPPRKKANALLGSRSETDYTADEDDDDESEYDPEGHRIFAITTGKRIWGSNNKHLPVTRFRF